MLNTGIKSQVKKRTMYKTIILWFLRKISWRFGYIVLNRNVPSLNTCGDDPREVPYLQDLPYSVQNLPAKLGVGLRFYPFEGQTYHPFILALKGIKENKNQKDFAFEVLKKYNQLCSLKTANDFLGLSKTEACFSNENHPYEYTYPWSTVVPHEIKKITLDDIRGENSRYGFKTEEALDLPLASDRKIWIETKRLVHLMVSIKESGFKQQSQDSLGCFVLLNGDSWRWYVHGGQHRAAVLAVLGYDKFPVCVRRIIRREDVDIWPQVQSGVFTREQALLVFDKLFSAKPPPVAKEWMDYVNQAFYHKTEIECLTNNEKPEF